MKNYLILAIFIVTIFYLNYSNNQKIENLNKIHNLEMTKVKNNLKLIKYRFNKTTKNIDNFQEQEVDDFVNEQIKNIIFLSRLTLRQKLINSFYLTNKLNNKLIYKEISFFNNKGMEIYKKSDIEVLKMDISKKENTFCKKEDYFHKINNLQEGQTYISKVQTCKDKRILRIITPIVRDFKRVGFLSVALNYAHINKLINKIKKMKG